MSRPEATNEWDWEYASPQGNYTVRLRLGEDGIVYSEAIGYEDLVSSKKILQQLRRYQEQTGARIRCCLDARGYSGLHPESRKLMRDALLTDDSPMRAFAVVGGNLFTRGLFNMYARVSNIPMRVHKSHEEALAWLSTK